MATTILSSCSTPFSGKTSASPVRKVDFKVAPRLHALAQRARQTGNQMYPKVCALLADDRWDFPRRFDVSLKRQLPGGNSAETRMTHICLNAEAANQFEEDPAAFDQVLIHEMAHVAQHYYRPIIGRWLVWDPEAPFSWREGIADYVSFKLGGTNGWRCAECDSAFPHYRDGYSCAGALLLYLEKTYSPRIVPQLNTVLRQGRYSDEFFVHMTGKDLPTLWAEFRQTPAFTPGAARMLELRQSLGFVDGQAPKDIEQRLKQFLDQNADTATRKIINQASIPGLAKEKIPSRLAILCYFTQPGGTAEAYVTSLQETNQLPGIGKGDHGTITGWLKARDLNLAFPATRSFTATKQGDASTFHYTVYRASPTVDWKLLRAWRTSTNGEVVEEYLIQ